MALPPAIQTFKITFGPGTTFKGEDLSMVVSFTPSVSAVWAATGTPLIALAESATAEPGMQGETYLPIPDQDGFIDGNGNTVRNWTYRASAQYLLGGRVVATGSKVFTVPAGTTEIDLDMLIPTTTSAGVTVAIPDTWSAAVADAEAAALSAEASVINSAQFVGDQISTAGTPANTALSATYARRRFSFADLVGQSEIIAPHRFGMYEYPENTRVGARMSIAAGFPVQETDVWLSADGSLVIGHDDNLLREFGDSGVWADYPLTSFPPRKYPEGGGSARLGDGWEQEEALTFEELLHMADGRCLINVEPKGPPGVREAALVMLADVCAKYDAFDRVSINSSVRTLLQQAITLGFKYTIFHNNDNNTAEIEAAAAAGIWGYDVTKTATDARIAFIRDLFDYTALYPCDTRADKARADALGVRGYSTNYPQYLAVTPNPIVRSTKSGTLRGRPLPGDRLDPYIIAPSVPIIEKGKGYRVAGSTARHFLGGISGVQPASGSIRITGKVAELASTTSLHAFQLIFGAPTEDRWNGSDNIGGNRLIFRYNGQMTVARTDTPVGSATTLGSTNTPALAVGTAFELLITYTPTTIQVTRVDTSTVSPVYTDAALWRGDYFWLGCNIGVDSPGLTHISEVRI